jgi:hypothetical protein
MFFFGIFGIDTKSKEIKDINNVTCKQCGRLGVYRLIKKYNFFHFFFIPLFKWGEEYFLVSRCCRSVFKISREDGRRLEDGIEVNMDIIEMQYLYGEEKHQSDRCPYCGRDVDRPFEYCPYCGAKL